MDEILDSFIMVFSWFAKYFIAGAVFSGVYASYKSIVEEYDVDEVNKCLWCGFWPIFLIWIFFASIINTAEKLANLYFKK